MVKCSKCGAEISGGKGFCVKCGAKVSAENIGTLHQELSSQCKNIDNNIPLQQNKVKLPKVDIKLIKTQNIIPLVIGIALILFVISYNIGSSLTSREKVIANFNKALSSKDSSTFSKYIVSSDQSQKVDVKDIDGLLKYLEKNPSYKNEIKTCIDNQSLKIEEASKSKDNAEELLEQLKLDYDSSDDLFTLKKKGTEISLGDKLICTADKENYEKEVGPFIPGLYTIKALLKGEYVTIDKKIDVDLVTDGSTEGNKRLAMVELIMDGYNVSVESDFEDAKPFVNGKDTGILVKDAKEFGPVPKDGSITLSAQKEFPWGVVKSEEVKVNGERSIELNLSGINDELTNTLMDTINVFNTGWAESRVSRDVTKMVNATEKRLKESTVIIQKMIADKELVVFNITKAVFNLDSMRVYQKDNKYYAEVDNDGISDFDVYSEGETAQPTKQKVNYKYILIYDETSKKWLVDELLDGWASGPGKTKEFTF